MPSSTKRPGDAPEGTPPGSKIPRLDHDGNFSGTVKKKLSGTTRTGQACDRCKVRKIRCDPRLGGCSPCMQNNMECRTTDRITGRATSRGHTENLETENNTLKQYVAELRLQLQENGIDARQPPALPPPYMPPPNLQAGYFAPTQMYDLSDILNQVSSDKGKTGVSLLPEFRTGDVGDNYLGVSSANDSLSPIKGTSLALFGMELDLKDFMSVDAEGAAAPESYETFLDLMQSGPLQEAPPLPPYQTLRAFCEFYFVFVNPYCPVLHKPTFMAMIDRMHHEPQHELTETELVQLHLVLAIMLYQYTLRNVTQVKYNWASYYRYGMGSFHSVMQARRLPNVQIAALICLLLRALPKPGAAWIMSTASLAIAVEMGLHRSVTAWDHSNNEVDAHEAEMRKRIFWSILTVHVTIGVKLGRPLAIRLEDFDVELPRPLYDNLATQHADTDWQKCSFRVGIVGFKHIALMMQIHCSIYSIKATPQSYDSAVRHIEAEMEMWTEQLPPELTDGDHLSPEGRVHALWTDFSNQHLRLLLHHPAMCRTQNQELMTRNFDICLQASSKLLQTAGDMRSLKALDSTWFNNTVWLAAIFTTLFAYSERKDQITSTDLNSLRDSMDTWLEIMGEVGNMLGSALALQNALRRIISTALSNISRHLATKTASAAVASASIPRSPPGGAALERVANEPAYNSGGSYDAYASGHQDRVNASDTGALPPSPYPSVTETALPAQPHGFTPANQFAYPDPANPSLSAYASTNLPFEGQPYTEDIKPDLSAQLAAHNAGLTAQHHHIPPRPLQAPLAPHDHPQSHGYMQSYGSPLGNGTYGPPMSNSNTVQPSGSVAWRNFADNMMNMNMNVSPNWSANALMALQGQKSVSNTAGMGLDGLSLDLESNQHAWPNMLYQHHQGGGGGGGGGGGA